MSTVLAAADVTRRSVASAHSLTTRPGATLHFYQPLVIVLAALCVGIVVDRMTPFSFPHRFELWWMIAAAALIAWCVLRKRNHSFGAAVSLLISIAAASGAWHHYCWDLFPDDEIGRFATETPQPVCVEAIARMAPIDVPAPAFDPLRSTPVAPHSRMLVDVVAMRDGDRWRPASGISRVTVDHPLQGIHAGDRIRIFGELEAPLPAANPGEFDSALYARSNRELSGIRVKIPECVTVVQPGSNWNPRRWIDDIRHGGDNLLKKYLPADRAGLAAAVLLGQREEVDHDTNQAFLETGTIHVLCIAGLHMGILAWLLFKIFGAGWLSRRVAILWVMGIVGMYMLLTMAQPPVVRATILIWIVCGGMLLGRSRIGLNSLALAGLILLVVNPADLFHTGVQLSFLSVAVLIWVGQRFAFTSTADPLESLIAATRPWPQRVANRLFRGAKDVFLLGAVLWVVITPLTMARFHLLAPSALVLNVLLTPALALAMLSGIGVLVFGAWLWPVAAVFGWVCNANLSLLENTVKWFVHFPGARFWVAGPSDLWLAVFYLALVAIVLVPKWLPPPRWRWALFGGWCGIGLIAAAPLHSANNQLRCTFIAVGHGGAELLELPGGKTLLYDAGRLGQPGSGAQSISCYLWSRGISHLDAVVLSHADTDHYNSLPELLNRFSVGVVYVSPVMFKQETKALKTFRNAIQQSGTKLDYAFAGDRLVVDHGVSIDVLHPPPDGIEASDNANCVVLSVQYAGREILLTGDLAPPGMQMVMNDMPLNCDVLQAPHHGSAYSDPADFVNWTTPKWVVICGNMLDGKVAGVVYEQHGATVLNTANCGAITVTVDPKSNPGSINLQTFRPIGVGSL